MKVLYSKKNGITNKLSGVNLPVDADEINYDNTESELQSTNVQDAIDEVNSGKISKSQTAGLVKNNGTIDTENYSNEIDAIVNVYGSKNLLVYPYYDGSSKTSGTITYTVDDDGVVSANGNTSSGTYYDFTAPSTGAKLDEYGLKIGYTYTLTGGIANKAYIFGSIRDSSNNTIMNITNNNSDLSTTFTIPNNAYSIHLGLTVYADVSNEKVYPMLRDARISDSTYVPYAKTNKKLTDETNSIAPMLNVYGSKNLLRNDLQTTTMNSVTYTANSDGSFSCSGTADATHNLTLSENSITLKKGTYIFDGCPSGADYDDAYILYMNLEGIGNIYSGDPGALFTIDSDTVINYVKLRVVYRYNMSGKIFKPMIRDARISDPTYAPYAMTNRELTEKIENYVMGMISLSSDTGNDYIQISKGTSKSSQGRPGCFLVLGYEGVAMFPYVENNVGSIATPNVLYGASPCRYDATNYRISPTGSNRTIWVLANKDFDFKVYA